MNPTRHDYHAIKHERAHGASWKDIADHLGLKPASIRGAYSRWLARQGPFEHDPSAPPDALSFRKIDEHERSILLTKPDIARIGCLEDLCAFFHVDSSRWTVSHYRINMWEQHSVKKGVVPLYQVRASLVRNMESEAEMARELYEQALEEMRRAPFNKHPEPFTGRSFIEMSGEPCLLEIAVFDPHIGMYGWKREVGADYDSALAVKAYRGVTNQALRMAQFYNTERILFVVGNDLAHVDALGLDSKAGARGGATSAGTMQDFDSRLPKMFSAIRRAVIQGIDLARLIAPTDVLIVPGNHDEQTMYRLGEVLAAWYRNDEAVDVLYDPDSDEPARWPRRRHYYKYGENAFMFTHGVEYKRKRDPLPLVFATECPADMWAHSTHREIHTGHSHIRMSGGYQPESDVTETRAIITRSLPGLTPEDSWHYNQGYKHDRAGTALIFRRSGGLAGFHEFTPGG